MRLDEDGIQRFSNLEDIRTYFSGDKFSTQCLGAHIDSYDSASNRVCVSMEVEDNHYNAQGFVMGGVFFTICDFALAVCCNVDQPPTASVDHSIQYMNRLHGTRLIAKASSVKKGRTLGFFKVDLYDDTDVHIAHMTATCMRTH